MEHEPGVVAAFVTREKRERVQELLSKPKRRRGVLELLYHNAPLDPECMTRIPPSSQSPAGIAALLRSLGAPDQCHVISTDVEIDASSMPLADVLGRIVGRGEGTILSCVAGQLAYYEAEDAGERYILRPRGGRTRG
jgi:hypothetical protein